MAYFGGDYTRFGRVVGGFDRFDPLLVTLHDNLKSLKNDKDNTELYAKVEDAILNLLGANLQASDKAIVSDIVVGIIKQARADVQESLSEKIARRSDLHPSLLHYLAYADISVAKPILLRSRQLADVDIMYIIQAKGREHWRVIARRPNITENVIACLASKRDAETNVNLLENETVRLENNVLEKIAETVGESSIVADRLINYRDLPKEIAVAIYWHVSNAVRNDIREKFSIDVTEIDAALEDSMQDFADTVMQADTMEPSAMMVSLAEECNREEGISADMLVGCLRRQQGRFFIALFAQKTNLKHSVVWSMMQQIGGQGLAVACRATAIDKKDFVSIFLMAATFARPKVPVSAEELNTAIRYYENMTPEMAQGILSDSIAR